MRKHDKQLAAYKDEARFKFLLAGRRGGKSELIVEDISRAVSQMPPNSDIFYIGPTNQQAKELVWNRLEDRFHKNKWHVRDFVSKSCFYLPGKRKVYIIGAEKIRRIRGHKVYRVYLDELAYFTADLEQVWKAVRPSLADLKGGAVVATTPDGKGSPAYKFYQNRKKTPGWAFHKWGSIDNPGMDPQEIEDARRELDEKSFRQEFEATWESYEGLAYYNFNEDLHVKPQEPINDNLPVILHFDFNVNPTTLLIAQRYPTLYSFKQEYSFKNSSTEATIKAFCEDYKHKASTWLIKIRGDSSGNQRSSPTGRADYQYVEEYLTMYGFKFKYEVQSSNPAIVDRVRHVNAYLLNAKGEHRLEIDPSMTETIEDLSSQELDGRHPSDKNNRGHKADSLGYGVWWDHITTGQAASRTIQL